jgi:hypothetical protein
MGREVHHVAHWPALLAHVGLTHPVAAGSLPGTERVSIRPQAFSAQLHQVRGGGGNKLEHSKRIAPHPMHRRAIGIVQQQTWGGCPPPSDIHILFYLSSIYIIYLSTIYFIYLSRGGGLVEILP